MLYYIPTVIINDRLFAATARPQPTPELAIEYARTLAEDGQQCGCSEWEQTPVGNVCTGRSWVGGVKGICAACGGPIGKDSGPPDGWQMEDGTTVCHACCVDDLLCVVELVKEFSNDKNEG